MNNPLMVFSPLRLRQFIALIAREITEFRGTLVITPFVVVAFVTCLSLLTMTISEKAVINIGGTDFLANALVKGAVKSAESPQFDERIRKGLEVGTYAYSIAVHFTMGFALFFYALSATFDERRDRSVLFWRSLPVRDGDALMAKVATALIVAPAIAWLAIVLLQTIAIVLFAFQVWRLDGNAWTLVLSKASPFAGGLRFLVLYVTNVFWLMPLIGWLFLVSAWAKRMPFLWATLVPALLYLLNIWAHWMFSVPQAMTAVMKTLGSRLVSLFMPFPPGVLDLGTFIKTEGVKVDMPSLWMPLQAFAGIDLWIGVAAGAAMLYGASQLRRYRDEG